MNQITLKDDIRPTVFSLEGCDHYVWCQFTGLHDQNGKEIYEGDVVQHHTYGGNWIVEWLQPSCGWRIRGINQVDKSMMLSDLCQKYLEILGNIYEQPELLEAQP